MIYRVCIYRMLALGIFFIFMTHLCAEVEHPKVGSPFILTNAPTPTEASKQNRPKGRLYYQHVSRWSLSDQPFKQFQKASESEEK